MAANSGGRSYGVLPSPTKLKDWVEQGRTRAWMVAEVERETGVRVSPSAISMALNRAGLSRRNLRYSELIPWRVVMKHQGAYILQLLRYEARRRRGMEIPEEWSNKVDHFLKTLAENNKVVYYDPKSEDGFWLVDRLAGDTDIIRQPATSVAVAV